MKKESALLGLPGSHEVEIYPNRSHSTIYKFDGDHDPVWNQVSDILYHAASLALNYSGYRSIIEKSKTDIDDTDLKGKYPNLI